MTLHQRPSAASCADLSRRSSVVESDKGPNEPKQKLAIKKVTNVFSKKILAKRALREIKLLQHFRGHRNVCSLAPWAWLPRTCQR